MTNYQQQTLNNNNCCFCIVVNEPTCDSCNNSFEHLMLRMRNFWRRNPQGQQLAYDMCSYSRDATRNQRQRNSWYARSSFVRFEQTRDPENLIPIARFMSCNLEEEEHNILQYLNFHLLQTQNNPFVGRHNDRIRVHRFLYREVIDPINIMVWRFLWQQNIAAIQFDNSVPFCRFLPSALGSFFRVLVGLVENVQVEPNALRFSTRSALSTCAGRMNDAFFQQTFNGIDFETQDFPDDYSRSQGLCCVLCNEIKRYTNEVYSQFHQGS